MVEQWLADHQAGFLARSAEALAATHAPDGTFESPAHGIVRGREAIRDIYVYWYSAFPDFMLAWGMPMIEPPPCRRDSGPSRARPPARSSARCGLERSSR